MRLLFKFQKLGAASYISHLDLLRCVQRTISRAGLPIEYSKGFNPHQKISFAQALGIGIQSTGEYFEARFTDEIDPVQALRRFNHCAPVGIKITDYRIMDANEPSIMSKVCAAAYTISFASEYSQEISIAVGAIVDTRVYQYENKSKSGVKTVNMRPMIISAHTSNGQIVAVLRAGNNNLNPRAFAAEVLKTAGLKFLEPDIMRTELYYKNQKEELSPLIEG